MPANAVSSFDAVNDGGRLVVTITTFLPAVPTLLTFCCPYRLIPKTRIRGGEEVPHGNLLYLDCEPKRFDPTGGDGVTSFVWTVPNGDYLPCKDCHLAIVEFGLAHPLDWTTQVHPCPPVPAPAVHFDGATWFTNPALVAPPGTSLTYSFWCKLAPATYQIPLWVVAPASPDPLLAFNTFDIFNGGSGQFAYGVQTTSAEPPGGPSYGAAMSVGSNILLVPAEWHHVLATYTCDVFGHPKPGAMWIDDTDQTFVDEFGSTNPDAPFLSAFAGNPLVIGGDTFASLILDLAEFWMLVGTSLDIGDETVRRMFITADGKPGDLGPVGEVPTGSPPTIYGTGGRDTFLQPNLGTGGAFALTGALTDADSSPHL